MDLFVIVEDKEAELKKAIAAVYKAYGVTPESIFIGIPVEEIERWGVSFEGSKYVRIISSHDMVSAEKAIELAQCGSSSITLKDGDKIFVITDLMFPREKGGKEQANGIGVMLKAIEAGFSVSVCSDTDHHEVGFLPMLCSSLEKLNPGVRIHTVLDSKNWDEAISLLLATR